MRCAACIVRSSGATNSAAYPARHISTATSNVLKTVRFIQTETPDFDCRPPNHTSGILPVSFCVARSITIARTPYRKPIHYYVWGPFGFPVKRRIQWLPSGKRISRWYWDQLTQDYADFIKHRWASTVAY